MPPILHKYEEPYENMNYSYGANSYNMSENGYGFNQLNSGKTEQKNQQKTMKKNKGKKKTIIGLVCLSLFLVIAIIFIILFGKNIIIKHKIKERTNEYKRCLENLDGKSQRLKVLTEDVVEASKASTGNIKLEMNDIDFVEMVQQVIGEFEEKFQEKNLTMMVHFTDEPSIIYADGQRMWRVLENVFGNVVKYAMEGTRVYAEISNRNKKVTFSLKNISAQPLNISADELTERFIRGDVARNTEGSGLGLSIAKSLTELQGGEFKLYLDGDLFKVMITFVAKNYSK